MGKNKKVLILGGTGIIGRELSKATVSRGYDVYVVSRHKRKSINGIFTITTNVYDTQRFSRSIIGHHFEAVVDLLSFNSSQVSNMVTILKKQCDQYILISSATIYQSPVDGHKISEDSSRISQGWEYPLNKIGAEHTLKLVCADVGLPYTIVRPYITYSEQRISFGVWEGFGIVDAIRQGKPIAIGDEVANTMTTLTHTHDLAAGITGLIANPKALNTDFNITSDEHLTWREVFELTAEITKGKLSIVPIPVDMIESNFPELVGKISDRSLVRVFDNSKLKVAIPDFMCKYSVRDGYAQVIEQTYQNNVKVIDYVMQGRIDKLTSTGGRKHDELSTKHYKHKLRHSNLTGYIRYIIGYYGVLYDMATMIKSILKRAKASYYR